MNPRPTTAIPKPPKTTTPRRNNELNNESRGFFKYSIPNTKEKKPIPENNIANPIGSNRWREGFGVTFGSVSTAMQKIAPGSTERIARRNNCSNDYPFVEPLSFNQHFAVS
jgi:hypothetical protein